MKTSNKKTVSDKLKKVRTGKKTDVEFPPSKGIQKPSELPKKSNKRKSWYGKKIIKMLQGIKNDRAVYK